MSIGGQQRLNIIKFLAECQNPDGGFGGGPYQVSHLAPTYATVNALVILGGNEAYKIINRETLVEWMNQLRLDDGSFIMHIGGEVDIRGVYCALSVAMLTNTFSEELFHKTAQWVLKYDYIFTCIYLREFDNSCRNPGVFFLISQSANHFMNIEKNGLNSHR